MAESSATAAVAVGATVSADVAEDVFAVELLSDVEAPEPQAVIAAVIASAITVQRIRFHRFVFIKNLLLTQIFIFRHHH